MKLRTSLLAAAVSIGFVAEAPAASYPTPTAEYSAQIRIESDSSEGQLGLLGQIYATPDKERREHTMGGQKGVIIIRRDKGVSWVVIPQQRTYMVREDNAKQLPGEGWRDSGNVEMEDLGTETVDGHETRKYRVTRTEDGVESSGLMWVTTAHNIVLKAQAQVTTDEGKSSYKISLQDLKIAKQDPSLFEPPEGYKKFDMPKLPQMPGMMSMPKGNMTPEQAEQMKEQMMKQMQEMQRQMQQGQ